MRRFFVFLFVCLLVASAHSQTATVTGKVVDPGTANQTVNTYVQLELINCGGNQARYNGTALLWPVVKRYDTNSLGSISGTVYRSDYVTCGGVTTSSKWRMTVVQNGQTSPPCDVRITTSSFDVTQPNCLNASSVVPVPTESTVYAKLDASNTPFTGKVNFYPDGAPPIDSAFLWRSNFHSKWTSLIDPTGIQIPSTVYLQMAPFAGGYNSGTHKTQWQPLRIEMDAATIGERKGSEINVRSYGKGDSIGVMASCYDWGGYLTGGDEGCEGGRFSAIQGDGVTSDGCVPTGTVTAIVNDVVTVSWSACGQYAGEQRPLIVTRRSTSSAGTIFSSSYNGVSTLCDVVGVGTGWLSIGLGAHGQAFLSISSLNNVAKHVVGPITSFTSDTTLSLPFSVAEIGPSCYGATDTGAYTIYRGAIVTSLVDPGGANITSTGLNFDAGRASNFLVGDTVEQPLGYNGHMAAVQVVVGCVVCGGSAGMKIDNVLTKTISDGIFMNGNFSTGLRFGTGTWGTGVSFGTVGTLLKSVDQVSSSTTVLQVLNSGALARSWIYDRTNDWWNFGSFYVDAAGNRLSTNSSPQTNVTFYLGYAGAGKHGLLIAPTTAPTAGFFQLGVYNNSGFPIFTTDIGNNRVEIGQGTDFKIFSDNMSTCKFCVVGSSGNTTIAGTTALGGGTAISKHLSAAITNAAWDLSGAGITCADQSVTVTGAVADSTDTVSFDVDSGVMATTDIQATAWISGADTVKVRLCDVASSNPSAFTSKKLRVDVWKH